MNDICCIFLSSAFPLVELQLQSHPDLLNWPERSCPRWQIRQIECKLIEELHSIVGVGVVVVVVCKRHPKNSLFFIRLKFAPDRFSAHSYFLILRLHLDHNDQILLLRQRHLVSLIKSWRYLVQRLYTTICVYVPMRSLCSRSNDIKYWLFYSQMSLM